MRLLVSAGGTGGGVYPALAVVRALGEKADVLWVGAQGGMEASLVARAGVAFEAVPAAGVHGVGLRALPGNLWRLAQGLAAARRVIRRFRPQVLFFTGGYVGVPVALAGPGIPKALYVPDLEPGLALRVLSRMAEVIAVTADTARARHPRGKTVVVTGYPTRPELRPIARAEARTRLGLQVDLPVLLVFGGSKGARSINRALWACLPEVLDRAQVLHLTGELDAPEIPARTAALTAGRRSRYQAHAYLHEEMAWALSAADLAVSRAGAATLGEFPLFGLPAVLVPYPHAWRYQKVNAEYLEQQGAAVHLPDAALAERLAPTVLALLADPARHESMAKAARRLARPEAASTIAAAVLALAETRAHA